MENNKNNPSKFTRPTSVSELKQYTKGALVELPSFGKEQPFVVRLRRPSLMAMAKSGKIPNPLLNAAGKLFAEGGSALDADNTDMLSETYDLMRIICEASLVEPTMEELDEAGIGLTDDQMMAIFSYAQTGVRSLSSFRR